MRLNMETRGLNIRPFRIGFMHMDACNHRSCHNSPSSMDIRIMIDTPGREEYLHRRYPTLFVIHICKIHFCFVGATVEITKSRSLLVYVYEYTSTHSFLPLSVPYMPREELKKAIIVSGTLYLLSAYRQCFNGLEQIHALWNTR